MEKETINIQNIIKTLTKQQLEILKIATNAIYFNNRSDYLSALWDIVNEITSGNIKECDSELFDLL